MITTTYHTWYVRADQAWVMVSYLQDVASGLFDVDLSEISPDEEIQMKIKEWKDAAEFAEKMMEELDKCQRYPHSCQPAKTLMFPFRATA